MRMRHADKTFRLNFTIEQDRACTLRRRLCAGLIATAEAAPELIEILYADDYTASLVAARTLGEHACADGILPLIESALLIDREQRYFSRQLRSTALEALGRIEAPPDLASMVLNTFVAATRDPEPAVVAVALDLLAASGADPKRAAPAIVPCLEHDDVDVKTSARHALATLQGAQTAA